jgi:N-acetylglutamate synthase-like GNAT family acetyltransferase
MADAMSLQVRPARPADEEAVLGILSSYKGLEVAFDAAEFAVAADGGRIEACGRLRRHEDGSLELASVAAARQGAGLGALVVGHLLARVPAGRPVYALALAPGFFARHGFVELPRGALPASVAAKAQSLCASQPYVAMVRA